MVGDGGERLAPVTYLPGVVPPPTASHRIASHDVSEAEGEADEPARWAVPLHDGSAVGAFDAVAFDAVGSASGSSESDADDDEAASSADVGEMLAKRLRRSALSEREARTFLRQKGVDAASMEDVIAHFTDRRWLDDAALAEQLVYAGTDRKGQGRRAIAQALSARGVARDVADAALDAMPDDDADRALEYARSKAHGLRSYDTETAMRRLMGQLARRGYPGSVASSAARTALSEQRGTGSAGGKGGGVQFR